MSLQKDTIKTPAWKAMSHGARSLYTALKGRFNTRLQNAVYISTRAASEELGAHSRRDNVGHWFRELEWYGFTRMVSPAHHGVNGHGKAPHWRLTEEWYLGKGPTRDFLNWNGNPFPKNYRANTPENSPRTILTKIEAEAHTVQPRWPARYSQLNPRTVKKRQKLARPVQPYARRAVACPVQP